MTLDFDPSGDLADVADGLASVTVVRPGSSQTTQVTHALCGPLRVREAERSEGRYTAGDVVWHLPVSELSDAPRPGDVVVDGEERRWTVLDVQKTTRGSRWRCVGRDLAVVHGLDEHVDVEKATYAKGEGGAETATWHVWKTGLRARIQPAEIRVEGQNERQGHVATLTVFIADDVSIDHTHRIKGPDGTRYRVVRYRKAERIDALGEIDVERAS
ncbi:MAG: hypothetical protein ACYTG0_40805 [Planctomycetota bacterium]|jgi:hypothetical protein